MPKGKGQGVGRPQIYNKSFHPQAARVLYEMGATDEKLCEAFGICGQTLATWKKLHPEFIEALKEGKGYADEKVVASLYMKATGYPIMRIKDKDGGEVVHYKEPDTTACIFWLKNRKPGEWRDKQDINLGGDLVSYLQGHASRVNGKGDDSN